MAFAAVALLLLLDAAGQSAPAAPPASAQSQPGQQQITVTGTKPKKERKAEEPYSMRQHIPLGSRIPRKMGPRTFNTVATNTGVAGLLLGGGVGGGANSMDGTGGSVVRHKNRLVKTCKADREEVSEETACILIEARKAMDQGDLAAADKSLAPLLASGTLSSFDRYYTGYYAYMLAEKKGDEAARERALTKMLASGRMPEADRPAAMRTLVAIAFKRGDDEAAIQHLEKLVESAPDDAQSQANLATLLANRGLHAKARTHMAIAVAAAERGGRKVPQSWTEYLREQQP